MSVRPIPDGYHSVTPYLVVKGAAEAIAYYKQVFGAVELMRMGGPGGTIGHAEIRIGNSPVMLADEHPDMGAVGPKSLKGSPVSLLVYVEDVDGCFARAVGAGGRQIRPVEDQFYGDRMGIVEDPFGHHWSIATHKEDLSPEELQRRHDDFMKKMGGH